MEVKNLKDPVFSSTETDTHFILTSNLEGYELKKITTMLKEDTTGMEDGGEKKVRRWLRVSMVVDPTYGVKRFRKFFWIPDGVVSNEIKTKFMEEESVLRIFMPKSVKGVSGIGIEEVKEEEIGNGRHKRTVPVPDKVPETENPRNYEQELEIPTKEDADLEAKLEANPRPDRFEEHIALAQLTPEQEHDRTESLKPDDHPEEVQVMGHEIPTEINEGELPEEKLKLEKGKGSMPPSRKGKLIRPCLLAGSAILLSLVLVIRL